MCEFICEHDFVHCSHIGCFRNDVKTMNKEKKIRVNRWGIILLRRT